MGKGAHTSNPELTGLHLAVITGKLTVPDIRFQERKLFQVMESFWEQGGFCYKASSHVLTWFRTFDSKLVFEMLFAFHITVFRPTCT